MLIKSYAKTALVIALASSSAYLLVSNNNLQDEIIKKNALELSQAQEITALQLVKTNDDLEIKKLLNQLSNEKRLSVEYQEKLTRIENSKNQFNRDLSTLGKTNETVKTWLDLEHSIDINRLLNSTQADSKNSHTN